MIADYSDLVAEVTERSGASGVANRASQYIGLAEAYMRSALRIGTVDLVAEFDGLEGAGTNWLLEQEPEAYLHAALYQVFKANGDVEQGALYKGLLDATLERVSHDAKLLAVKGAKINVQGVPNGG